MSRRYAVFDESGMVSETFVDVSWEQVRYLRTQRLADTDFYYFSDKWATLNTYQKGQLNAYRLALRDLPQDYDNPNDAYDAMDALEVDV
jgi:hypothetical protein